MQEFLFAIFTAYTYLLSVLSFVCCISSNLCSVCFPIKHFPSDKGGKKVVFASAFSCYFLFFNFFLSQVLYITHTTLGDSSSDQRTARSARGVHRPSGKGYKREVNNRFWSYSCSRSKETRAAFILTPFLLLLLWSAHITRMKMYFFYTTFFLSD